MTLNMGSSVVLTQFILIIIAWWVKDLGWFLWLLLFIELQHQRVSKSINESTTTTFISAFLNSIVDDDVIDDCPHSR